MPGGWRTPPAANAPGEPGNDSRHFRPGPRTGDVEGSGLTGLLTGDAGYSDLRRVLSSGRGAHALLRNQGSGGILLLASKSARFSEIADGVDYADATGGVVTMTK